MCLESRLFRPPGVGSCVIALLLDERSSSGLPDSYSSFSINSVTIQALQIWCL